jgi:hypothetical protein
MDFDRYFSAAEAERMLPLVKRIVADILEKGRALRALASEGTAEGDAGQELRRTVRRTELEIRAHVRELESLGCYYKDFSFQVGLVDFPAIIGGQSVFLCWRSDEERVGWYHPIEAGYAGRTPIPRHLLEQNPDPANATS